MTFGEKLRELRESAGLTQAALAAASKVPIGTIRDYEQVRREPLLSTAFKLAKAIGVSVEEFSVCVVWNDGQSTPPAKAKRGRRRKKSAE
jgi:transcriptional regulator with XRE-family HTH domain